MVSAGMDCFLVPWMPKTHCRMPFFSMNSAYGSSGSSFSTSVLRVKSAR